MARTTHKTEKEFQFVEGLIVQIRFYCSLRKFSIPELSQRSGVDLNTIRGLIYSKRTPTAYNLALIANALDVGLDALVK